MAGEDLGSIRGKIEIEYDDSGVGRARRDLAGLESTGQSTTSNMTGFFGGMVAGVVQAVGTLVVEAGRRLFQFAGDALRSFASFETGMNEVFTLLPGISGEAMATMTQQVLDTAKEMEVLPEEVVPALYSALSAGIPPENVFDFLINANKLAQGGVTDLNTAVTTISGTVNAYGSEIITAEQVSDNLMTAVRTGATTIDELGAALSNVVPTAAGLGISFDQVTAAISTMTAQGVPTSQATTQLRQLFVELSKAGGEAAGTFEDMAGKSFRDFIASGGNVQEALQLMEEAAVQDGVALTDLFGSVEAGNAALFLTGAATDTFTSNLAAQQDAAGSTDAAFQTMQEGVGDAWEEMKVSLDVFTKELLIKAAPLIEGAIRFITQAFGFLERNVVPTLQAVGRALQDTAQFVERNSDAFKIAAAVITAIYLPALIRSGIMATINAATTVASFVAIRVAAIVNSVAASLALYRQVAAWIALGVASSVNAAKVAVAWVIANAGAGFGIAAFVRQIAQWAAMGTAALIGGAKVAAGWAVAAAGAVAAGTATAVSMARIAVARGIMLAAAAGTAIWTAAQWLLNVALTANPIGLIIVAIAALIAIIIWIATKTTWFQTIWAWVWDKIGGTVKFVWGLIQSYLQALFAFWSWVWNAIVTVVTTYINIVRSIITTVVNAVKAVWDAAWNAVKTTITTVFNFIRNLVTSYINAWKLIISTGLNFIRNTWNTAWNAVKTAITTVINAIKGIIQGGVDRVKAIIGGISAIVSTVRNAFNNARDAASDRINALISLVRGLPDRAKTALGNLASKLYSAGRDLISGMVNGVKDMAGNLARAATDAVGNAVDAAKNALGIGSPSKLAAKVIGGPIMQGVAMGVTKESKTPANALVAALSTLPKFAAPTVNAVVSGESGGSHYTFGPGSIVLDASKLRSIQDVVDLVQRLRSTSRQFAVRRA
jgi:TP901 family phage tail tape measure protein